LGKANALLGEQWEKWLEHVKIELGPRYFLALFLTAAFCVRISQALKLEACHFDWGGSRVWFEAFKKHPGIWKRIVPSVKKRLYEWKLCGIQTPLQTKKRGARGEVDHTPKFEWPESGFLFPSRNGASAPHASKDVVCHAIARVREKFVKAYEHKWPSLKEKRIRSHSGRRHAVSWLWGEGVDMDTGMAWAQIESPKVYRGYIDREAEHVGEIVARADKRSAIGVAGSDGQPRRRRRTN
jgi:integrase